MPWTTRRRPRRWSRCTAFSTAGRRPSPARSWRGRQSLTRCGTACGGWRLSSRWSRWTAWRRNCGSGPCSSMGTCTRFCTWPRAWWCGTPPRCGTCSSRITSGACRRTSSPMSASSRRGCACRPKCRTSPLTTGGPPIFFARERTPSTRPSSRSSTRPTPSPRTRLRLQLWAMCHPSTATVRPRQGASSLRRREPTRPRGNSKAGVSTPSRR
mmetsp:Transcript_39574/g.122389  ORF Transcript_39574/g.122389 Transcript_39574/m.122389 type:complete len:212 (+) Transcript_39574:155-790(+)